MPSEHQIDGVNADLEIHVVHLVNFINYINIKAAEGGPVDCNNIHNKLTVFGLLFNRSPNATNYTVFDTMVSSNINTTVTSFDLRYLDKNIFQCFFQSDDRLNLLSL